MGRVFFTVLVCVLVLLAGPVAGRDNVRVGSPIDTISFSYCNGAQYDFGALTPNPDHYTYTLQVGPGIIDYLGLWTWDDVTEEEVGVYQGLEILVCDTSVDTCDLYMIGVMPSVGGPCRITDNCMGRFYMNTCSIYRRDVRFFDCSGCRIPVVYTIENDYDGDVSIDAEAGELRIWPSKRFGTYEIYFDAVMPSYFAACHFTVSITGCCSGLTGNVNCDFDGLVDISDLFYLVAYLFGDQVLENFCIYEANINGDLDLIIDIADLTALVNYLFVTFEPPASCTPW